LTPYYFEWMESNVVGRCIPTRVGNRVNRVYPRGQPGGYIPSLIPAGWLPRGYTAIFCMYYPEKPGYPPVSRKYRVFETYPEEFYWGKTGFTQPSSQV
jgi:hypothetical protein